MTCASCAVRVERTLNGLDGVSASVNFATETATVDCEGFVDRDALCAAVESAGYRTQVATPETPEPAAEESSSLARRAVLSSALALPVLLLAMVAPLQFDGWEWPALVVATPVVVWGGWPF